MTLQLAPWTTPTFSPTFYSGIIVFEPVSGRLVQIPQNEGGQALYTDDLGETWIAGTGIHANFRAFNNAVVANGVIVVAGTQETPSASPAVSRSTDGGATWTTTLLETLMTTSGNRVAYDETFDQFLHYSTIEADTTYVRVSTDDGATWGVAAEVGVPMGFDPFDIGVPTGGSPLGIIVANCPDGDGDALMYSDDGGLNFVAAVVNGDFDPSLFGLGNAPTWCGDRWVFPFVDGTGCGFLTSEDGEEWDTVRPTGFFAALENVPESIAWNDASGWLYFGTDDGAFLTDDFLTLVKVDDIGGDPSAAVFPSAVWFGNVIVQVNGVFSASANPIQYALASENDNVLISGLDHLEGLEVSVVNDGVVLASPNNPAYTPITVTGGQIELAGPLTGTVTVGLPITSDIQTLDIETRDGTRKDAGINVTRLGLWLEETMGLSARSTTPTSDTSLDGFRAMPMTDENGNTTTDPVTGYREVGVDGAWTKSGSIFIRNVDPTPMTIHSISPQGTFGN